MSLSRLVGNFSIFNDIVNMFSFLNILDTPTAVEDVPESSTAPKVLFSCIYYERALELRALR
jgi:hypothetical protein